jgi:hypothetical protein
MMKFLPDLALNDIPPILPSPEPSNVFPRYAGFFRMKMAIIMPGF